MGDLSRSFFFIILDNWRNPYNPKIAVTTLV